MNDASAPPLDPAAVSIRAVQFVGTNVEMTWWVEAPDDEAEARLQALLSTKLGLFAATRTGTSDDGRPRFSVIASPLDRLFHKIGPTKALTVIKHASVTMELSEVLLARQGQGLVQQYPGAVEEPTSGEPSSGEPSSGEPSSGEPSSGEPWRPWDVGKLLGAWIRKPDLADHGGLLVADVEAPRGAFPNLFLPIVDEHVAGNDGAVRVLLPAGARAALRG